MPGEIKNCLLCGCSKRESQSLYKTINSVEQENRIRDGYSKRYKQELNETLMNKQVHRTCYRSIIRTQPLAATRATPGRRARQPLQRSKRKLHSESREPIVSLPSICSSSHSSARDDDDADCSSSIKITSENNHTLDSFNLSIDQTRLGISSIKVDGQAQVISSELYDNREV